MYTVYSLFLKCQPVEFHGLHGQKTYGIMQKNGDDAMFSYRKANLEELDQIVSKSIRDNPDAMDYIC